jgi:tetratricopeptide (TPR) repeat protein
MTMQKIFIMLMGSLVFGLSGCAVFQSDGPYVVEEQGRTTLRATFSKKMDGSAAQWSYAQELRQAEKLRRAEAAMLYLFRRWPNSLEAPRAARARADMLHERGRIKEAFKAYQYLIDNYASRMDDYDAVLDAQFDIAVGIMNQRKLRWMLGGFKAPENAVPYFEDIIRNGPQWKRAVEAQYLIGEAYVAADELELAIAAFAVLGYRYPDSEYAEDALWQQIVVLEKLHKKIPDSHDVLDRLLTTSTLFLATYPQSGLKDDVVNMRNRLYEIKAQKAFDAAECYAKVLRKPEAAILAFKQMMEEFPRSALVPDAERRIAQLEAYLANPYAKQL